MVVTFTQKNTLNPVLQIESINESVLRQLFLDEIVVLRIPDYVSWEAWTALQNFTNKSRKHFNKSYYVGYQNQQPIKKFYGIHLLGTPYNSTYYCEPDHSAVQKYFYDALPTINILRKSMAPYLSPIDQLRLELDEHWPKGARVATFPKTKNMFVGIYRFMHAKDSFLGSLQPHFDSLPRNVQNLEKQYSANIYMNVPLEGGELEIWNVPPLTVDEVVQADIEKDWRSILPPPILIQPKPRELIMFNTRRPHAVKSFNKGTRSSLQCFIGMYKDEALELWS